MGSSTLNSDETFTFAAAAGFGGSQEAWASEFESVCRDLGIQPQKGLGFEDFKGLVNDSSPSGCYCSNADLDLILQAGMRKMDDKSVMEGDIFADCDVLKGCGAPKSRFPVGGLRFCQMEQV